jgi:hypothetical protein
MKSEIRRVPLTMLRGTREGVSEGGRVFEFQGDACASRERGLTVRAERVDATGRPARLHGLDAPAAGFAVAVPCVRCALCHPTPPLPAGPEGPASGAG